MPWKKLSRWYSRASDCYRNSGADVDRSSWPRRPRFKAFNSGQPHMHASACGKHSSSTITFMNTQTLSESPPKVPFFVQLLRGVRIPSTMTNPIIRITKTVLHVGDVLLSCASYQPLVPPSRQVEGTWGPGGKQAQDGVPLSLGG
jgi:hypothetical protein